MRQGFSRLFQQPVSASVPGAWVVLLLVLTVGCAARGTNRPDAARSRQTGGTLQVSSNPSGARIILDGTATNFRTPTSLPGISGGRHRVLLTLPGHRNWEGDAQVTVGKTTRVEAALAPVATGSMSITSVPAEAQIILDGQPLSVQTPAELKSLPVGTHTILLQRDGYDLWSQAMVVIPDRHLPLQAVLTPSRKDWGHIRVQSSPPAARISLDGYPTGKRTPDILYNIQAGSHHLELAADGYRPWSGAVTVRENQTENLLVKLPRPRESELGGARIESDPPGASISLDGVLLRQKTPADLEGLALGTLALELTLPGYRPWRGELSVVPGKPLPLTARLTPAADYGGSLRIESDPPGAAIAIDSQPTGVLTPALLPDLTPAHHRLTLTLPGHREWIRVVAVTAGATERVHARLAPDTHRFAAKVTSIRGPEIELEFTVRDVTDEPAEGTLVLFVASNATWQVRPAQIPLAGGKALVQLTLPTSTNKASLTVGLDADRASFRLQRDGGGWFVAKEE